MGVEEGPPTYLVVIEPGQGHGWGEELLFINVTSNIVYTHYGI